jgi:hypothetical protein
MTPVVQNVRSLATRQNQTCGTSGNAQLPPAKRHVAVRAGERDSSQGESSVLATIQGQNHTPSSSLKKSRVAAKSQSVTSTPSATPQRSIITPTTTPGTRTRNTPASRGTIQTDSTRRVVSIPASGIGSTPTPLSRLEKLPTLILNPEARGIITNPLRTQATNKNQRQR